MLNRLLKIFAFLSVSLPVFSDFAMAQDFGCVIDPPKAGDYRQTYNASYNSTLVRSNNAYSNRYIEVDGRNSYRLTDPSSVFVYYRGQKHLDDKTNKYEAFNADIGYSHFNCLTRQLANINSVWYGAPVNRELRKYDHSHGQMVGRSSFVWTDESATLRLSFLPTVRRHFFRYMDNSGGKTLKAWSFDPTITANLTVDDFNFEASFVDFMGWDFDGEQLDSVYYHEEVISYKVTEKWSVSLTHKSDGRVANYGGTGLDISLHDRDRSEMALGVSFTE